MPPARTCFTRAVSRAWPVLLLLTTACEGADNEASGSPPPPPPPPTTGGVSQTGGAPATGGVSQTGGAPATGGVSQTGGAPASGGHSGAGGAPPTGGAGTLVVYPDPSGLEHTTNLSQSSLYAVTVNGQPTFVYRSANRRPEYSVIDAAHFVYFSFADQPVTVAVTKLTGSIGSATVRPHRAAITPQISGEQLTFTLPSPRKVLLQIDGDSQPLLVFADEPDTNIPSGPGVTRFGPGYHDLGRNYDLADDAVVYVDGGAVVEGTFGASDSRRRNVTLRGRGIVYAGDYAWPGDDSSTYGNYGIFHQGVENSRIEGIIALDSEYWNFGVSNTSTTFENLKIIAWEKNTDGIWVGPDSTARDCFIMTDDDTVRPVSSPGYPDSSQTLIENLVIWHQAYGRPLYVPVYPWNAPYVQNITYRDIDVIRSEHDYWAQSFIPANGGSGLTKVRDILYENIVFEEIITPGGDANRGSFFVWETSAGSSISNITFRSFHTPLTRGTFTGRSATESISNLVFDGFFRDGERMTNLSQMGVTAEGHVYDVEFR